MRLLHYDDNSWIADSIPGMGTTAVELGELMLRVVRELRRGARGMGMPPHHLRALRHIADGPIRPARLAETLGITPRAVTDVVDALVESGLVGVAADPDDRRAKVLTVTDSGSHQLEEAKARRDATAEELFGALDEEERRSLVALLRKVVDGRPADPPPGEAPR